MFNEMKSEINSFLLNYFKNKGTFNKIIYDSASYSLNIGGKRIRPLLMLLTYNMYKNNWKDIIEFSAAIEMIHTYSLIHDDLPCMDNDDLRRGKPSCHKAFGEDTALLAGDALLTHAFEIIAMSDLSDDKKVSASLLLAQNSGVGGMIGGQVIDLIYEKQNPSVKQLLNVYKMKTGALISAACLMGCISAGANENQIACASKFAYSLGIAFQIQDDILDIIGDEKELGKPIGSDAQNDKTTYATLLGIDKAKADVEKLTQSAISQLDAFEKTEFLKELALKLVNRKK